MTRSVPRRWKLVGVSLVVGLSVLLAASRAQSSMAAEQATYSGQATAVRATVLGNTTVLSDTGALPPDGGAQEATLLDASVPGLLTAEVLHASTIGQGNQSESEASVANVTLTVGGNALAAGFLMATANVTCQGANPGVRGSSEIVGLVINGQSISVSGEPNQTVTLPNGVVVMNEQQSQIDGKFGEITVNALHITVNGLADIVVSSAHADMRCAPPPPPCNDFATGGGWITGTPSSAKANFGVAGGIKNGGLWGHLSYIDHGTGLKVKGTGVTEYVVIDDLTRLIKGTVQINGQAGFTYEVTVADNGEPGRSDTFALHLSNSYEASGKLAGGNIQLHKCR